MNSSTGVRPYTATINNGLGGTITKVVAVGIPVWLRTNVSGGADVALSQKSGASVTVSATGGATGVSRTFAASDLTYGFTLSETFELKKADGSETIHLDANTPTLVEVIFAIDGDKLVAADFTENANLKLDFSGVDLQFTSDDVA